MGEASEATDRDLEELLLRSDADVLTETRNSQLATITMSLVILDAVERLGIAPTACAGHSLGEYTALVAAGALGFDDGMRVVSERGEAMQAAADGQPGRMVMLEGCDADTVDVACRLAEGEVWVANYNSPTETVIAGADEAVERACRIALGLGAASAHPVAAGGAFHTPFMAAARPRLRKALHAATLHRAETPVVANVDALVHTAPGDWELLLSAQLCSPVRWRQTLLRLASLEVEDSQQLFVEIGPGSTLSTTVRQTLPGALTVRVGTPDDLDSLVDAVAGDTALHAFATGHHGEHLYVSERVVISPRAGIFEPASDVPATGAGVDVGTVLGQVSGDEVRSPFAGSLMGMLAQPGERVQTGQPIAWLRAT